MIYMPDGYSEAPAVIGGEFPKLPAGGYVCRVVKAQFGQSKSGLDMLTLAIDIADGGYKDYFRKAFDRAVTYRKDAKWPCQYYQLTGGESVGRFKGLVQSFEESNDGFIVAFPFDETLLSGKLIGGVFREEEYISQRTGKSAMSIKCYSLQPVEGITEVPPPQPKMLEKPQDETGGAFGGQTLNDDAIPF